MCPSALLVAEASGALGILVGVLGAELAGARSTPRATESVDASEEAPRMKSSSQPRSAAASPSPTVEVRPSGEPTPASAVLAAPPPRLAADEVPSKPAVQIAVRQLIAIFAAARQLCPEAWLGLRETPQEF